jgi:hypothetical protein
VSVATQLEVLPTASAAVIVTGTENTPTLVNVPATGDWDSATEPPHASTATADTVKSGTSAWQLLFALTV